MTSRAHVWQELSAKRVWIASKASASDGLAEFLRVENRPPNPSPPSHVVSQCQAVSRLDGASLKALIWSSKTSRASLASSSGSLMRPRLSPPSW